MWKILMSSPIVHGNLNIRGNRKLEEINLLELRKGHMIWNYNQSSCMHYSKIPVP